MCCSHNATRTCWCTLSFCHNHVCTYIPHTTHNPTHLTYTHTAKELSAAKLDAQSLCEALDSTLRSLSGVAADLASLAQQPQAWLVCCAGGQSSYRSVDNAVNTQHLRCVEHTSPFTRHVCGLIDWGCMDQLRMKQQVQGVSSL